MTSCADPCGIRHRVTVPQPTPMIVMLTVHTSRAKDLSTEHRVQVSPSVPAHEYRVCSETLHPRCRSGRGDWILHASLRPTSAALTTLAARSIAERARQDPRYPAPHVAAHLLAAHETFFDRFIKFGPDRGKGQLPLIRAVPTLTPHDLFSEHNPKPLRFMTIFPRIRITGMCA
jgi:hypothetical protein